MRLSNLNPLSPQRGGASQTQEENISYLTQQENVTYLPTDPCHGTKPGRRKMGGKWGGYTSHTQFHFLQKLEVMS